MYKHCLILILVASFFAACDKQDLCLQYASNSALARFRTYTDSLKLKDTIMPAPLVKYDAFANQFAGSSRITFSLNGNAKVTRAFVYPDSANLSMSDTLFFYYQPKLNYVSKECGYNYFYDLDSVITRSKNIKKIDLLNTAVTNKTNLIHIDVVY
jgi:hypothetical protein